MQAFAFLQAVTYKLFMYALFRIHCPLTSDAGSLAAGVVKG